MREIPGSIHKARRSEFFWFSPPRRGRVREGVPSRSQKIERSTPVLTFPRRGGRNFLGGLVWLLQLWILLTIVVYSLRPSSARAEPLRIAYTSIAMVYGPLWLTKDAGIFKKYGIEPELLYIAG